MKEITQEELNAFFKAMERNNLSYRQTPRTKEEVENLMFVYNSSTKEYYTLEKGIGLSADEKIVTAREVFSNITRNIDAIKREDDEIVM
ncbi:MAG: hypothetical protein IJW59_03550 [Clostridia bacterium]|nr:hypothetical protein [Clostridia bacterium]